MIFLLADQTMTMKNINCFLVISILGHGYHLPLQYLDKATQSMMIRKVYFTEILGLGLAAITNS